MKAEFIPLFERYEEGILSKEEKAVFENRLKTDTPFAQEYNLYKEMIAAMKFGVEQDLRADLQSINKQLKAEGFFDNLPTNLTEPIETELISATKIDIVQPSLKPKLVPKRKNTWWSIAASLALLLGAIGLINTNYSNKALGNLHTTELVPELGIQRGETATLSLAKGREALEKGDYSAAISFFERIPATSGTYPDARFYLAYAQFQLEEYEACLSNTQLLLNKPLDTFLQYKTEWLQLQTLLATNQHPTATFKKLLNKIASDKHHLFKPQALTLQEDLNSIWRKLVF